MRHFDRPGYQLAHLIAGLNRRLEAEIEDRLRPEGLSVEQFRVLSALGAEDGRPMGELAEFVFVDSPTLTKIVDRMVAGAMVYRAPDPKDRRKVLIFLSSKGKAMHARLSGLVDDPATSLVERLGGKDAEALKAIITQLMHPT